MPSVAPALTAELMTPMFQVRTLDVASRMAAVLGRADLAADLADRAAAVRAAFAAEYVGPDGALPVDLQGPYVVALAFDLVAPERRPLLLGHLERLIAARGGRLDTGFLSVPYLLDVLWDSGRADLARGLLWQDRAPSWLAEVDRGATTIWESWDAVAADGAPRTVSLNHYAFGCVDDVLYRRAAGIRATAPGYRSVEIAPDLAIGLDRVRGSIDTPYGIVAVAWELDGHVARIDVDIPLGVAATLRTATGPIELAAGPTTMTLDQKADLR